MNGGSLRVAYFTDCYDEVNGVARTSRAFVQFARARSLPFLTVHAGSERRTWAEGTVTHCEFQRGFPQVRLDKDLAIDLAFIPRHLSAIKSAFQSFQPDVVHATGPSDCGLLGMILAHQHRVPMIASCHTNLHEYASRRVPPWVPVREMVAHWAEQQSLALLTRFYGYARRTLAPNPELVVFLEQQTKRPSALMERGVDTVLFHPVKRMRECDDVFRIGYVGRLSREKNVRSLVELQDRLRALAPRAFQFCIVGQGDEQAYLERHLHPAFFRGILRGESLSRAYADFDAFVFPSETDTYGNAVLEALASGVPALVTDSGGPKYLVEHEETGFVCRDASDFARSIVLLMRNQTRHTLMRAEARKSALRRSWDSIFEGVYESYMDCL